MCTNTPHVNHGTKDFKVDNENYVPSLNLSYLKDDDARNKVIGNDLNDFTLDKAPTDSTVSLKASRASVNHKDAKSQILDELFQQNKRQKLIEMIMIDQLSRTRVTVSEKMLSRKIQFGARILTLNGQYALRELAGFFFDFDKTLTVYEFKQFGKSFKAMPFIKQGQYYHNVGPNQGFPYSLSDIYTGANIKISTEGQLALPEFLAEKSYITLRITDVDETERRALMDEEDKDNGHINMSRKFEKNNRQFLHMVQGQVQKQICKRGIQVTIGLGRYYRKLDQYNTGILDQYSLEKGLKAFHINLEMELLELIFNILDPESNKLLCYKDYMQAVVGEMSELRKALVRKAFMKLDISKTGIIHISDVKKFFNSKFKTSNDGASSEYPLQAFLDAVQENAKQEHILYLEFEEYYEGLSLGLSRDENFVHILCSTWNI